MNELATTNSQLALPPMRVEEILQHHALIADVMEKIMKPDMHYGIIPGTSKPTLYQAGAELLSVTFRLVPTFTYDLRELPNMHREYIFVVNMSTSGGALIAQGFGSCSTMEEKYRWRIDATAAEPTGKGVQKRYWDIKDSKQKLQFLRGICEDEHGNFGVAKVADGKILDRKQQGGEWQIVRYPEKPARVENENIADVYNTVGKIAYKRAYVSAAIKATAASDTFTQDVEDLVGKIADIGGDEKAFRAQQAVEASINIRQGDVQDIRDEVRQTITENTSSDWQSVVCHVGKAEGPLLGKTVGEICGPDVPLTRARKMVDWFNLKIVPMLGHGTKPEDIKLVAAIKHAETALIQRESEKGTDAPPNEEKPATEAPSAEKQPSDKDTRPLNKEERDAFAKYRAEAAAASEPSLEAETPAEVTKDPAPAKSAKKAETGIDWRNVSVPFECKIKDERLGNLPSLGGYSQNAMIGVAKHQLCEDKKKFASIPAKEANKFKAAIELACVEMCMGRPGADICKKVRDLCSDLAVSTEELVRLAEGFKIIPQKGAKIWEKHEPDDLQTVIRLWPDFAEQVKANFNQQP